MTIGDWWWVFFRKRVKRYFLVGKGINAEETECRDLVEAVGMAQELAATRKITVYVCEVKAMTNGGR